MLKTTMFSKASMARCRQFALLSSSALMMMPGIVQAQSGTFGGTVPATFSITDTSNASLSGTLGSFSTLTVGSTSTLSQPTVMQFRLRSNADYKLSAVFGSLSNITDGTKTAAGTTAAGIQTGDIGFGFTAAIVGTGASVSNGGSTPTRTDTIVTGFDVTGGWASLSNGHTPSFTKTLHDIASSTQILSGERISASGDNSSSDNFLLVTLGVATLPQFFTAATFSGTVTLTIAANP